MLPGRQIDDDGAALFRLSGGGKGTLTASQVLVGDINDLAIDGVLRRGRAALAAGRAQHAARRLPRQADRDLARRRQPRLSGQRILAIQRTPGGHPEGYLEAFANIYRAFGEQVRGAPAPDDEPGYATMDDALRA